MFTKDIVNIPEKVKFNKKNSGVYVYHIFTSSYSKEKKYTTDKRVLIGKMIDDKTMHPNPKYFELYESKTNDKIELKIDENKKKEAILICEKLGIDLETYLNICISKLISSNDIPFDMSLSKDESKSKKEEKISK